MRADKQQENRGVGESCSEAEEVGERSEGLLAAERAVDDAAWERVCLGLSGEIIEDRKNAVQKDKYLRVSTSATKSMYDYTYRYNGTPVFPDLGSTCTRISSRSESSQRSPCSNGWCGVLLRNTQLFHRPRKRAARYESVCRAPSGNAATGC